MGWDGFVLWFLAGASQRITDFFAVAPVIEAPGSFTEGVVVEWL
jgi:hypothetical protein